ncbi:MAG: 1,4-dihydroxy-2-naphthoate polyprenyltransferase [Ginsengibacter sp.]
MGKIISWIKVFRLRTLPLSFSSVILGSFLAYSNGYFIWPVLTGALLTTLFLQILSNLANDYGDTIHGVDNNERIGPKRGLQSGEITLKEMKGGVITFSLLSFISGTWLLTSATSGLSVSTGFIFLLIGLVAIAAAIKYTIGKNPYGYMGFGDIAVFIFFGLVGVLGTYYLHSGQIPLEEFLPATSIGLFSTGVLNLNNLRDRENDRSSGKITMIVKLGLEKGRIYHAFLLFTGLISALAFTFINYKHPIQFIYLITFPLFIRSVLVVFKNTDPALLYPELKKLALATLAFAITFGLGLIL